MCTFPRVTRFLEGPKLQTARKTSITNYARYSIIEWSETQLDAVPMFNTMFTNFQFLIAHFQNEYCI